MQTFESLPHHEFADVRLPTSDKNRTIETNQSFVLSPAKTFSFEDRPVPSLQSSRHVRIRVVATGLCGSDVHYWQHGRIGGYVVEKPIVLGHESAGIVEECGEEVKSLVVGDRVALEPGIGCNTCETCRGGRYNLCESMQFAATPPYDGTLSTFYCLPEECCFKLPSHISLREGALVEPLSIAVHCCSLAGNLQGRSVGVFGAGPIGLLCSAVAQAFGASKVVVVDAVDSRLMFARAFGIHQTYKMQTETPELNASQLLADAQSPSGFDVVIDATGAQPCIACGVAALKRGGVFIQAGLGAPKIDFPIGQICDKEATLKGSFRYGPGDYKLAIGLLDSNRIRLSSLITHEFVFEDAEQAFQNVASRGGIKSIIYGPNIDRTLAGAVIEQKQAVSASRL
ncbi:chaperonin 10-like protein [Boeremia exigua]|uniref:chaperonin 10-like protein n=1 Tax=Boeremia exigua TaxID=749465 RepID=UPI001E8E6624|nr:chaperonin 10-like protein [Boeremia exigua]KAH6639227.1 chaperonin 10-like protein [Boeremia exigua]